MATDKKRSPLFDPQHFIESGRPVSKAKPRAQVRVPVNFQAVGEEEALLVERLKEMAFEQNRPLRALWMEALAEYLAKREDK